MIFDPREVKQQPVVETKNTASAIAGGMSFPEFLMGNGNGDLSSFAAIMLYMDAMPLFNAIAMRSQAFAQIPIRVWDKAKQEFINDHAALDLLAKPNADVSQMEFLEAYSSFYDITGNSFLLATGRLTKPPLELMTVPPQSVTFGVGNRFGILHVPDTIRVTTFGGGQNLFEAEDTPDMGIRFTDGLDKELWHSRTFNPLRSSTNFWGAFQSATSVARITAVCIRQYY